MDIEQAKVVRDIAQIAAEAPDDLREVLVQHLYTMLVPANDAERFDRGTYERSLPMLGKARGCHFCGQDHGGAPCPHLEMTSTASGLEATAGTS